MLYTLARRYDEYDGENYEGSSCRGAIKGWFNNGVCLEEDWPYAPEKSNPAEVRVRHPGDAAHARRLLPDRHQVDHRRAGGDLPARRGVRLRLHPRRLGQPAARRSRPPKQARRRAGDRVRRQAFAGRRSRLRPRRLQHRRASSCRTRGGRIRGRRLRRPDLPRLARQRHGRVGRLARRARRRRRAPGGRTSAAVDARRRRPQQVVGHRPRVPAQRRPRQRWPRQPLPHRRRAAAKAAAAGLRAARHVVPRRSRPVRASASCSTRTAASTARTRRSSGPARWGASSSATAAIRSSSSGRPACSSRSATSSPTRAGRQPVAAGAGEWLTDKTDLVIEKTIGRPFAKPIWSEMKENAALAFAPRHGGELLLDAIQALASDLGPGVRAPSRRPLRGLDHPRPHAELRWRSAPAEQNGLVVGPPLCAGLHRGVRVPALRERRRT